MRSYIDKWVQNPQDMGGYIYVSGGVDGYHNVINYSRIPNEKLVWAVIQNSDIGNGGLVSDDIYNKTGGVVNWCAKDQACAPPCPIGQICYADTPTGFKSCGKNWKEANTCYNDSCRCLSSPD